VPLSKWLPAVSTTDALDIAPVAVVNFLLDLHKDLHRPSTVVFYSNPGEMDTDSDYGLRTNLHPTDQEHNNALHEGYPTHKHQYERRPIKSSLHPHSNWTPTPYHGHPNLSLTSLSLPRLPSRPSIHLPTTSRNGVFGIELLNEIDPRTPCNVPGIPLPGKYAPPAAACVISGVNPRFATTNIRKFRVHPLVAKKNRARRIGIRRESRRKAINLKRRNFVKRQNCAVDIPTRNVFVGRRMKLPPVPPPMPYKRIDKEVVVNEYEAECRLNRSYVIKCRHKKAMRLKMLQEEQRRLSIETGLLKSICREASGVLQYIPVELSDTPGNVSGRSIYSGLLRGDSGRLLSERDGFVRTMRANSSAVLGPMAYGYGNKAISQVSWPTLTFGTSWGSRDGQEYTIIRNRSYGYTNRYVPENHMNHFKFQ